MFGFILGAMTGMVAAYYWHDRIRQQVQGDGQSLRDRAADTLVAVGRRAGTALDRTKSRLDQSVQAGEEKLRSRGTAGSETPDAARQRPWAGTGSPPPGSGTLGP